ncbi:MAG: hypothetical protein EON54_14920, partial [Alcaligenaceae bacterium]
MALHGPALHAQAAASKHAPALGAMPSTSMAPPALINDAAVTSYTRQAHDQLVQAVREQRIGDAQ